MKAVCQNCSKEFTYGYSKTGKFCSNQCNGEYKTKKAQQDFWEGKKPNIYRDVARRFLSERRGYKCEVCGIDSWNGKEITLHVDHVNGDPSNNHPENLRLICPNCHSQTPFLGNANKGRGRGSLGLKH